MNDDAKYCFDTAAANLQQAINTGLCSAEVARDIVMAIVLGAIRWNAENQGDAENGDPGVAPAQLYDSRIDSVND
jgi:hypothetical protein